MMFSSNLSFITCAKCIVAVMMVSALLTVSMMMYLCLKNTVSAMHMLLVSITQTLWHLKDSCDASM